MKTAFIKWFDTFLEEKKLPFASWEIDVNGTLHIINNEVVIEHIRIASKSEQAFIKNTIVKIDFANGSINHFFKHLATCIARQH